MNQAYSQELRADTNRILIPALTIGTFLIGLFFTVGSTSITGVWHYWLAVVLAPLGGWLSWSFVKKGHTNLGAIILLFVQYAILTILLLQEWRIGSAIPYLFGILILASTMLGRAESGFLAWGVAVFILVAAAFAKEGVSFNSFLLMSGPIFVNLGLAIVAFLSAVEWQYAVETVSDLHINVQRRRDELFGIQEELKMANASLEYSNVKIDQARQEALDERDIRTRFMNNVSHELRTPLNAIVNFAHILRLGGRGSVTEGQIDYLERVEHSGWHLLSVLNDLLDMAQIRAGEFKLHIELCDLHALCEEAMTSTRGLLLDGEVDLVRDYPEEWPVVHLDKMRIKQALINLLGNAVKYTEEGFITLRVRTEGNQVLLSVIDTGIGIAPQHHEAIFQEFRQVNEADARTRVGTGLGLPITKHLVERHGGTMWIESEVGKGATFTLVLPMVNETAVVADDGGGDAVVLAAVAASGVGGVNTAVPPELEPLVVMAPVYPPPTMAVAKRVNEPVAVATTAVVTTALPSEPGVAHNRLLWVALAIVALFILAIIGYGFVNGAFGRGAGNVASAAALPIDSPAPQVSNIAAASATPSQIAVDVADAASAETTTNISTAMETAVPTNTVTPAPTTTPTSSPPPTASPNPTATATTVIETVATATVVITPTIEVTNSATALINSSLYQAPDATSPEVTFVEAGDLVTVVGRSSNGNWLYVRTADGLSGFVFNERVQWNGDSETMPIVNNNSTPVAGGSPVSGELALDLYVLPGTARCDGQTWYQTIFMRGQGGNGTYSYYWDGQEMATAVVAEGITFEVSQAGGTLTGTGEVLSGGQSVFKTLFITPPDCN